MARPVRRKKRRARIAHFFVPHEGNARHPHSLRGTTVLLSLALVFLVQIGFLGYESTLYRSRENIASVLPSAIALLTNEARAEALEEPLAVSSVLSAAAQKKAEDMARGGYFAHREPSGEMPWHWFGEEGYDYIFAGENLAVNFSDTKQLVDAWLASPTHRDNIVKPQYRDIGIGMATGTYKGREAVFVVQFFGTRKHEENLGFENPYIENMGFRNPYIEEKSGISELRATSTAVLGEETSEANSSLSSWQNIKFSPRTMNLKILTSLFLAFACVLLICLMPHLRAHPHAIRNGFAVLAILVFFFAFQSSFLGSVELPGSQAAAVTNAVER